METAAQTMSSPYNRQTIPFVSLFVCFFYLWRWLNSITCRFCSSNTQNTFYVDKCNLSKECTTTANSWFWCSLAQFRGHNHDTQSVHQFILFAGLRMIFSAWAPQEKKQKLMKCDRFGPINHGMVIYAQFKLPTTESISFGIRFTLNELRYNPEKIPNQPFSMTNWFESLSRA